MLRKHGHRINHLAAVFFRSTSYIHKVIANAKKYCNFPIINQRKMPHTTRIREAFRRWQNIDNYMVLWEGFINGSEDKPP